MKPYHISCGSEDLSKTTIVVKRGRHFVETQADVCDHCHRIVEPQEVARHDRRLSVIVCNGKAYRNGREII
jgi:hypothetical protein